MITAARYSDAETGFVYLRARYYDPATGQFVSRDPLTAMTGTPYGYVYGNPLNSTDPLGLVSAGGCGRGKVNGCYTTGQPGKLDKGMAIVGGIVLLATAACILLEPCGLVELAAGGGAASEGAYCKIEPASGSIVDEVLGRLRGGRTAPNREVDTPGEVQAVYDNSRKAERRSTRPTRARWSNSRMAPVSASGESSGGLTVDVFKPDGTHVKVHLP